MNGLVAPKPAATALTRWTRPAEFLVYLVPVGTISAELYGGYVELLQQHSVIAIRQLTRPGGYAAELSPFRSFAWDGSGVLRFRFVSTTDKIDTFDGEDVHASARAIGVLGICHCPTTPSLPQAYAQFMDSIRHFPGLLVQKCFAFEHQFDLQTVEECAPLSHLVMFPVYHELHDHGHDRMENDGNDSRNHYASNTVSLHLEVVLDTMCVTILMSLESTVRAAMRQQTQTQTQSLLDLGDAASFLLDTNVEPQQQQQQQQYSAPLSPFPSRDFSNASSSSSTLRSLPSTPTNDRSSSGTGGGGGGGGGVSSLFVSAEARNRRRHVARQRKLFGDYAVLLSCVPDAIEHYATAMELLRDEERRSSGAAGDALWLAAALEGYVFCLYLQSQDKFVVEMVDRASEALALYVKAGVSELEIALVENMGWYYTAVAVQLSTLKGADKVDEAVWIKRLLWEVVERGVMVFAELPVPRQVHFLIQCASMLEAVGHHRRMALFLHEAVALVIQRWRSSQGTSYASSHPQQLQQQHQRTQELRAALRLETITATRLGMSERTQWEITSLQRRTRRLRRQKKGGHSTKVTLAMAAHDVEPWLVLRFHALRQLITIAKMLADPLQVGRYCIHLLQVLSWCDEIACLSSSSSEKSYSIAPVDVAQMPFTSSADLRFAFGGGNSSSRLGLHTRASGSGGTSTNGSGGNGNGSHALGFGVYATPPPSIETKSKRYFSMANSPSATMSSAAATITSTIANTPRTLLATPRQQLSAAVSAISTKATPSFASSLSSHHHHHPSRLNSPSRMASSSLLSRSSSATAAELLSGSNGTSTSTTSGSTRNNSFTDGEQLRVDVGGSSGGLLADALLPSSRSSTPSSSSLVWDLRSRAELHRLQRRVLSLLETECVVMRPSEQIKLSTFVRVHKMRVLHATATPRRAASGGNGGGHPLLRRDAALQKCRVSSSCSTSGDTTVASPAFFYNPFDKSIGGSNTNKQQHKKKSNSAHDSSDSEHDGEDDNDDKDDGLDPTHERSFPVHERVRIEVTLSNPFGVELDLQQVAVWISDGNSTTTTTTTTTSATSIEAYPSSVVLQPYEKRKKLVLGVRALRSGTFTIAGCYIKVLNIKTSFALAGAALPLVIVDALPLLSIALAEIGSLAVEEEKEIDEPGDGSSAAEDRAGGEAHNADEDAGMAGAMNSTASITDPICMFANETKRCVLHVRNTGHRAVHSLHVMLRAGKAQAKTVFSALGGGGGGGEGGPRGPGGEVGADHIEPSLLEFETDGVSFKCLVSAETLLSLLPLERGDRLAIPFEVSLLAKRRALVRTRESESRREQLQWTILYGGGAEVSSDSASQFFRESQHLMTLVSLGSLLIHSVQVVGKSSSCVAGLDDHTHCVVVVEVVNPTETVFLLRMRESCAPGDSDWDIEIGRQSSRCLVIELLRQEITTNHQSQQTTTQTLAHAIADTLNGRLELTWKTYFGTTGRLLFQPTLWSEAETSTIWKRLHSSAIRSMIEPADGLTAVAVPSSSSSSGISSKSGELSFPFPFRFYQPANRDDDTALCCVARLWEPCVLVFTVRRLRLGSEADCGFDVDAHVTIHRDCDHDEPPAENDRNDDSVLLSGQTRRLLDSATASEDSVWLEWQWRVACVFLSEGSFYIALRCADGGTSTGDQEELESRQSRDVWCCRPLRIQCMR